MNSPELTFAAMTGRTEPSPRLHSAEPVEHTRARPDRRARVHPTVRWQLALGYASGAKVESIAAEHGVSSRFVVDVAREFGLPLRGHAPQPPNPEDIEHLRRWARRKAKALRREAFGWDTLAELE